MSLTATARSLPGGLRSEIVIDGRFRIETDEPVRLGGGDTAPAPHELLVAALAACVSTTLVMYAKTKEWDLGQVVARVDYDQSANPRRCTITVTTGNPLSAAQIARLEKVAASCPVRRSIETGIVFSERIDAPAAQKAA